MSQNLQTENRSAVPNYLTTDIRPVQLRGIQFSDEVDVLYKIVEC